MLSTDGIRTGAGGVVDEVEQRLVDVEDDELEVRAAALDGVRGGAELAVEGEGVVVEALHAARVAAAEQGDGRREAPHRRQRRHADPAGAQAVQALHACWHRRHPIHYCSIVREIKGILLALICSAVASTDRGAAFSKKQTSRSFKGYFEICCRSMMLGPVWLVLG